MKTEIRKDFHPVPWQLERLLEYAEIFKKKDGIWSHLKNEEDFNKIYNLKEEDKKVLEIIYEYGRYVAGSMAEDLVMFNYAECCPTLTSFIDRYVFTKGCVAEIDYLKNVLVNAEIKMEELGRNSIWAIGQMISLFNEQIELLEEVKKCIDGLKSSDIFMRENGIDLSDINYNNIIKCINNIGKNFEINPPGKDLGEEQLRNIILNSLSGSIPNLSFTGETYNKNGKTDIMAKHGNDNIFIAECKIWNGKNVFLSAINQLFSYMTPRDNKCALIIFTRNVNFFDVINKAKEYFKEYVPKISYNEEKDTSWFQYEINNNGTNIELALMIYCIP
jgi:hypothetical protein